MADVSRRVRLLFDADTNQAKNNINDLVSTLQKIQAKPVELVNMSSIQAASKAAMELQQHLQRATNTTTGRLDLSRFSASLVASGQSIDDYRKKLSAIGPEGDRSFKQLIKNINDADASGLRINKTMSDFLVTMKNTAKWQLSSSMMHGFMGAIQTAYGYAQSLDKSLNDIRIVSGKSTEEMARFAVEANKAAQALSTTTTRYTQGSLIYFQQGDVKHYTK